LQQNSINRQLFVLAVPMILSNVTVPLLGLVDTAVLGHLSHAYYLGGSSVGAMIITVITWLCGFLRMSTTGLAAQRFGAKDKEGSILVLLRGMLVALIIGLSVIMLQGFYIPSALYLAGGSEQVQHYAMQYSEIRIWGVPAALANLVLLGWLLGHHQAKTVMWLLIATNLINLSLDILFVVYWDWKVAGVAYATLIAEYSSLILGLVVTFFSFKGYWQQAAEQAQVLLQKLASIVAMKRYLKLNSDILIRTLCLQVCFVFITFQGARLGDNIVAANAILMNFLLFISFGLDGIANAAEVMVGKAYGQAKRLRIRAIVWLSLKWTFAVAVLYTLGFWLFDNQLINLISDIPEVVSTAHEYVFWLIILPLLACWCYLFDGIYIGLTQARAMRNSMMISTLLCFFPVWFVLQSLGNHGLWIAFSVFMVARGITLGWHAKAKLKLY